MYFSTFIFIRNIHVSPSPPNLRTFDLNPAKLGQAFIPWPVSLCPLIFELIMIFLLVSDNQLSQLPKNARLVEILENLKDLCHAASQRSFYPHTISYSLFRFQVVIHDWLNFQGIRYIFTFFPFSVP